jgi:hypothetical protein
VHPDVRKMLLTAKAYAEGGRALTSYCSMLLEKELNHPDEKVRKDASELLAMLTPIVKAFITDNGWSATSGCLQVFGGHGYVKEWGMEQYVRDARINMIYEAPTPSSRWTCWAEKFWATTAPRCVSLASSLPSWWRKRASTRRCPSSSPPLRYWATR